MKITLKGIPPSLNRFVGRGNTWEYRAAKKEWTEAASLACLAQKDRPGEPYQKALVQIAYFFRDRRRHDSDNYAGKFLLDGLTQAGVIADDDLKHITVEISGKYDKNNPRTEILVTETCEKDEGNGEEV